MSACRCDFIKSLGQETCHIFRLNTMTRLLIGKGGEVESERKDRRTEAEFHG